MRMSHVLVLAALVAVPFAESILAAGPAICTPKLKGGRVVSAGSADCDYHYRVDGAMCSAKGKCPDQNNQKQYCIVTGGLTYAWTVTKTGGSGTVSPATFTGPTLTVTVADPPVSYTVACMVSGCSACCALNPPTCSSPVAAAAAEPATPEAETKNECGGR